MCVRFSTRALKVHPFHRRWHGVETSPSQRHLHSPACAASAPASTLSHHCTPPPRNHYLKFLCPVELVPFCNGGTTASCAKSILPHFLPETETKETRRQIDKQQSLRRKPVRDRTHEPWRTGQGNRRARYHGEAMPAILLFRDVLSSPSAALSASPSEPLLQSLPSSLPSVVLTRPWRFSIPEAPVGTPQGASQRQCPGVLPSVVTLSSERPILAAGLPLSQPQGSRDLLQGDLSGDSQA